MQGIEANLSRIFNPGSRKDVVSECLNLATSRVSAHKATDILNAWSLITALYEGNFPGYCACNTEYHDFNHTCDVLNATIRMYDGAFFAGIELSEDIQLDLCLAAMLHDVGYIQEIDDTTGTGAKYTKTHVQRSVQFCLKHAHTFNISDERAERIGRLITGTDLGTPFQSIPSLDTEEAFALKLLASADLMGQMADRTYLEKLLFLYYEFKEAGFGGYDTEFDMLKKTISFYEMTKERLFVLLGEVADLPRHHFLHRYQQDTNLYVVSIERQIDYLKSILADESSNFRKKLKRIDLEEITKTHQSFHCAV